ncbi:MAG: hypothetical protein CMD33_01525, partial [Flavobacteriales bacterium]|nr:hypothetical protein [Flavobacteriales bacterium]
QNVPDYVPTDGLVAWYPFNGNANDESGNGNDGVATSVESAADRFGVSDAAFYFSGSGCTPRVDIDMNTTSITEGISISIWINRQGNGCIGPRIFEARPSVGGDQGLGEMMMAWDNNYSKPQQWSHNTSEASATAYDVYMPADSVQDVPNSTWALFVYTNDGAVARFYQNGIQISSMSNPSNSTIFLPSDIALGRMNHPAWDAFNGLLDDVGFWNRALSPCEITALYGAELSTANINAGTDLEICSGDSVVLTATGGIGDLDWTGGLENGVAFVPDSTMSYVVTGGVGSCAAADTVTVTVLDPVFSLDVQTACDSLTWLDGNTYVESTVVPSLVLQSSAGCDSIVSLDLTVNYTTYNTIDTMAVNVFEYEGVEYTEGGEFTIFLDNAAGCDSVVTLKLDLEFVGLEESLAVESWSFYPNPVTNQLSIDLSKWEEGGAALLTNAIGQVIWEQQVRGIAIIDVSAFARGVYTVEVRGLKTRERQTVILR